MAGEKPSRFKVSRSWLVVAVVVVVIIIVLAAVMFTPSISPIPTIRDTDADGVADALDVFPTDPNEWADSDGDGVGDNRDVFPSDPLETLDSDSDGVGDNKDVFPEDSTESRDADQDGVGDNADFWDLGDGGLTVRVELFELLAGPCDPLGNCWPSFRLEVDIDQDGTPDVARRADFMNFLDTEPLVDPVHWTIDLPEDVQAVDLVLSVLELHIGVDFIDVHPDPEVTTAQITVDSPFSLVSFVTQGDTGVTGRLSYAIAATAFTQLRTVSIIHPWSGSERDLFLPVLEAFTDKTGIQVEDRTLRQEELQTLLPGQFSAGWTPADVIFMRGGFIRDWGDQGWAVDVSGVIDPADYLEGSLTPVTSGSVIYGGAYTGKVKPGFWYKDSLFTTMGWDKSPANYNAFVNLLADIATSRTPFVSGDGVGWPLSDVTEHFIATYGGAQMHRDLTAGTVAWTDPSVKAIFTDYLVPLLTAGYFGPLVEWTAGVQNLQDEVNALYFQGSWLPTMSQITDTGSTADMRAMALPGGVADQGVVFHADHLFIPTSTTKMDEAQELFQFLLSVEGQEKQIEQGSHFATNVNVDPTVAPVTFNTDLVEGKEILDDLDDTIGGSFQTLFWAQLQLLWSNPSQLDAVLAALESAAP